MPTVRPNGTGDARTERVPDGSSIQFERLATEARTNGLVWLRDHFLADPTDPDHLSTLLTVMHLDLGKPGTESKRLTEYRRVFTALRTTPEGRKAVAELEAELVPDVVVKTPPPSGVEQRLKVDAATENTPPPPAIDPPPSGWLSKSISAASSHGVPELAPAVASALGFSELVRLGQGGFGTVYAARQPAVGNRLVAIKYTAARSREPQVLAALQHPNIMPVWSVHESAGHRVFCMPLHGRTTVADVLKMIDRTKSLPATGAGFLSAASVTEAEAAMATVPAVAPADHPMELAEDAPEYESERRRLEKLGYVESVVRGMTRLADALAHAHRRRVVHLDIKPANILITDDGGLMILDFGLAYQNGVAASPEAGGTVRYMAPEQLTSFVAGQGVRPDPRMDLYALGLVFFELLTGRHPFAESLQPGVRREEWVAARHRHPPKVRRFNPAVPPGVEAIVLKLLHPDRSLRYQSAEQLLTDLTRQQDNQPLQYAANPSAWERFKKFRRRHPVFSVAVMAGLLAVLAAGGFWVAHGATEQAQREFATRETTAAKALLGELLADQTAARIDAGSLQSGESRTRALRLAERWRETYHLHQVGQWRLRPEVARLTAEQQAQLTSALGEQSLLAAHAERLNSAGRPPNESLAALERSVEWNRRAEAVFGPTPPAAVGEQRASLARLIGRELPPLPQPAADEPLDLYLRALGRIADGDHSGATAVLKELERQQPQHAAGQFALGYMFQAAGLFREAAERFQVAKALAATDPRAPYNRGVLQLAQRLPDEAVTDLTTALDRDPTLVEGYFQRATARLQLGQRMFNQGDLVGADRKFAQGLADVQAALEREGPRYRFLLLRVSLKRWARDNVGMEADRKLMEQTALKDEHDYFARGNLRNSEKRYEEARADFARSTEMNPWYVAGWNNLAAVQARLGLDRDAADSFGKVLDLMPEYIPAKYQRAVLLARLYESNEALALINGLTPPDAGSYYQKAAVYALTSRLNLNDRSEALSALRTAVRSGGIDWDLYDTDKDFDAVRDLPDFIRFRELKGRPVD